MKIGIPPFGKTTFYELAAQTKCTFTHFVKNPENHFRIPPSGSGFVVAAGLANRTAL